MDTKETLPSLDPLEYVLPVFHYSHPSGWKVMFHCGFYLYFSSYITIHVYGAYVYLFWRNSYSIPLPISKIELFVFLL